MDRRHFLKAALATSSVFMFLSPSLAADEIYTGIVPGVAIGGYDSVAYFTIGEATKGDQALTTSFKGAEWRFSSQENLDLFLADPEKYAPQYGGYCAYAASKGALAKGDPEAWTVYEDKLYLNFSKSVRALWKTDIPGNVAKADVNYPKLLESWPNVSE